MDDYDVLLSICRGRHSTRFFLDRPVPGDVLAKVLALAKTSPYAGGSKRSWDVLEVRDRRVITAAAEAVQSRVEALEHAMRPEFRSDFQAYARSFTAFEGAPLLLVPTFRTIPALSLLLPDAPADIVQMEQDTYVKSISCVAMLLLLGAQSVGLSSCYMTGALIAEDRIGPLFGVQPGHRIGALIPIGYEKDPPNNA